MITITSITTKTGDYMVSRPPGSGGKVIIVGIVIIGVIVIIGIVKRWSRSGGIVVIVMGAALSPPPAF